MSLFFKTEDHSYHSVIPDGIEWLSVTGLLGLVKPYFDAEKMAVKSSKSRKGKWKGMKPKTIEFIWKMEAKRATDLGTYYHNQQEALLLAQPSVLRHGKTVPVIPPLYDELHGHKVASVQRLTDGVYPEHLLYLKSAGLCGQADLVEVVDGVVDIGDYKTNKEIKRQGYTNWEGVTTMMHAPVSHLEDCNHTHYNLQLSLYMYMVLKHNPALKPGKITIYHVKFESLEIVDPVTGELREVTDEHGFPVHRFDESGNPVVKDVSLYQMPYLKQEVQVLVDWYSKNRAPLLQEHKVKKAKEADRAAELAR